jgi:hypothetical protein
LTGYSTKRSNRHFLRAMLSRSIIERESHDREAQVLDSRTGTRKVGERTAQQH